MSRSTTQLVVADGTTGFGLYMQVCLMCWFLLFFVEYSNPFGGQDGHWSSLRAILVVGIATAGSGTAGVVGAGSSAAGVGARSGVKLDLSVEKWT